MPKRNCYFFQNLHIVIHGICCINPCEQFSTLFAPIILNSSIFFFGEFIKRLNFLQTSLWIFVISVHKHATVDSILYLTHLVIKRSFSVTKYKIYLFISSNSFVFLFKLHWYFDAGVDTLSDSSSPKIPNHYFHWCFFSISTMLSYLIVIYKSIKIIFCSLY